jgi:hypothetical protein
MKLRQTTAPSHRARGAPADHVGERAITASASRDWNETSSELEDRRRGRGRRVALRAAIAVRGADGGSWGGEGGCRRDRGTDLSLRSRKLISTCAAPSIAGRDLASDESCAREGGDHGERGRDAGCGPAIATSSVDGRGRAYCG